MDSSQRVGAVTSQRVGAVTPERRTFVIFLDHYTAACGPVVGSRTPADRSLYAGRFAADVAAKQTCALPTATGGTTAR
jgi:hypothetical protein